MHLIKIKLFNLDYVGSFLQSGNTWDLLRVNQLFTGWLTRSNFSKRGRVALVGWDCKIYAISVSEATMNVSKAEEFGFYEPEGMENRLRASCVSDAWIRIFWAMSSSVSGTWFLYCPKSEAPLWYVLSILVFRPFVVFWTKIIWVWYLFIQNSWKILPEVTYKRNLIEIADFKGRKHTFHCILSGISNCVCNKVVGFFTVFF